jgi:hypothetical protein
MDVYTTGAQRFEHLEELTRQGEERKELRRDPNAMPDSYSLLNTLRAVGEFLDRKPEAKLLFASNRGSHSVRDKGGVRNLEEYPISTLYDLTQPSESIFG